MNPLTAIIVDPEYYEYKKEFVNSNFDVRYYITYDDEMSGEIFNGSRLMYVSALKNIKFEKVVVAMPLSPLLFLVNEFLLKLGVKEENIVLLFEKGQHYGCEDVFIACEDLKYKIQSNGEVMFTFRNHKFLLNTDNELYILKEIFGFQCYNVYLPYSDLIVIDAGMNIGVASIFFSGMKNVKKIYSYEPFPQTYERGVQNLSLNDLEDKVIPHCFGLSNRNESFNVSYDESLKGLMSITRDNTQHIPDNAFEKTDIKVADVSEVFQELIHNHPDCKFLFKIDTEGSEYDMFHRLNETGLLRKADIYVLEWHNTESNHISQLESIFQENNFMYHVIGFREDETGMLIAMKA